MYTKLLRNLKHLTFTLAFTFAKLLRFGATRNTLGGINKFKLLMNHQQIRESIVTNSCRACMVTHKSHRFNNSPIFF